VKYALLLITALCITGCAAAPTARTMYAEEPGLTKAQADAIADTLWQDYRDSDEGQRLLVMTAFNQVTHADDKMPIHVDLRWDDDRPQPDAGYPVYISMHGGGAFTPGENDEQWAIQQERYPDVQGLYICPRSARDTWDHWHEGHMFGLIDTLVRAVLLRDDIDPDRVYLLGYCSGGNGVYQLGPILADRWAAVSATKGIPEGPPLANLRNCPIDIQWGQHDPDTIDRPGMNRAAVNQLYDLHNEDRGGYTFREIEHWRQGRFVNDKSTVNWLARHTRNPYPTRVVWEQNGDSRESSNPLRHTFYYLAIDPNETWDGTGPDTITADLDRENNAVHLEVEGYDVVRLRLNDAMLDLDQDITVTLNGQTVHEGPVHRRLETLQKTLEERGDRRYMFPAELVLPVPAG